MYYYSFYESPIGTLTIAGSKENIVGLWIENQKFYMEPVTGWECREKETKSIHLAKEWLDAYFAGNKPVISELPLELIGSDFQKQVWKILKEIPYGQVTTYGDIARQIAKQNGLKTMSAQAVGGAVGRNPISIIVPCHRVVGTRGKLTGYAGGLEVKRKLLELEGIKTEGDFRVIVISRKSSYN